MLYVVQKSNDYHSVARVLENDEAVAFIAQRKRGDPDGYLEIAPEKLTCQSWWEYANKRDGTCIHAWGDDSESDICLDHLERQHPYDSDVWHCRELGIAEAFELDLEKPSDGLDLSDAILEIRPQLLGYLDELPKEVSIVTAPSLFATETSDVVRAVEAAYYFSLRLEYAGVIDSAGMMVRHVLEGSDWELGDEDPVSRIVQKATCSKVFEETSPVTGNPAVPTSNFAAA
ncbi:MULTISPECIES: hypothetical protein [Rhizobium/Agrobacterium group]|uniref:hypothetical protein n=1 Tax=Rhizobium/Agrobacterium group TaxID=227290 RepID=UPI0004599638|nr:MULTISPECIES: hypothetical protein [Rhizobium/Agrobacterium group]CAD7039451.1 hypothetical protein RP007_04796 [Rhizobium sp. P007]CDN95401.1 hypothetical protein BN949_04573 [Agrobacterium tumefaciens]